MAGIYLEVDIQPEVGSKCQLTQLKFKNWINKIPVHVYKIITNGFDMQK